jgi:hypothetical protein
VTDAIEFGPEIKRGSPLWPEGLARPVWLADGVRIIPRWHGSEWSGEKDGFPARFTFHTPYDAIRLPISHPASIAQKWNDDNPGEKPFDRVWFGDHAAPADWDGGKVLLRCGVIGCGEIWHHHTLSVGQIIAYRSKPSEQTVEDDGYVRIKRMTEAECRVWAAQYFDWAPIGPLEKLGIIRPETPAERFKRAHPGCDDWTNSELIEAAATFFGGEK